jgi:Asp-tRNA(Asn)/Glu-tRNA(Gln) amidotransferase A subunit family amidase
MTVLPATLTGLQRALALGQLSQQESLSAQRQRLKNLDPIYHCVVQVMDEAADNGGGKAAPVGKSQALAGIGLAHKDIFNTAGRAPGVGHDRGRSAPGLAAASAIQQLQNAGASHLASVVMAEFACGATGDNPHFPRCINPLNKAAVVGGSSSGSAVAVASEIAYGAMGTDTAGSVRIPAATCGLLGLKTTHGLISQEGVHPLAPSLDSVGLLTRSAADARQLLDALTLGSSERPNLQKPRLKAWIPEAGLHDSVASALTALANDCNVTQRISQLAEHRLLTSLSEILLHHEAATTHQSGLLNNTLSASVQAVALPGLVMPLGWYQAAVRDRGLRARAFFNAHLKEHDILMLPALPQPVPDWSAVTPGSTEFDVKQLLSLHSFMGWVNYLGFPSLVMPIASDARGLPICAQFIARPFEERTLLAFADGLEIKRFGHSGITRHFSHLQS